MSAKDNTLVGFILSKATQTRKEAKKKDKKKKKNSSKNDNSQQQSSNLLTSSLSSVTNLFKPEKGKPEEVKSETPRSSGGATGLAKILTGGFGSLTSDTLGLASGLASITSILNQQLKAQSFTASGVQAISAILTDQLENQTSIVSGIKSLQPSAAGRAPRSVVGGGGGGGGSKSGDNSTLVGALLQRASDMGIGAAAMRLATSPQGIAALITLAGSFMRMREVERMKPFVEQTKSQIDEENKKKDTPWYKKLGNFFAGQALSSPQGPANQIGLPTPGGMYSEGVIIPNNNVQKHSSGTIKFADGMMSPGMNSMIGEAGKEAVVDLNSRSARNIFDSGMPTSPQSEGDPGMKASGASTLAVVDQFIKGMGPLGAPVAQALGPDISNLARTFGMSQTLPNIKVGGGRFKEDANAKKTRDKFLENLIAGSLESLDAKKKEENVQKPDVKPPQNPGPTITNPDQQNTKTSPAASGSPGSGQGKPMDDHKPKTGASYQFSPNLSQNEAKGVVKDKANQKILPVPGFNNKYFVLSDRSNGNFEVWERGFMGIGNKPKIVGNAKDRNTEKYKDPVFSAAFNEVRANYLNEGPQIGVQFGYINDSDIEKKQSAVSNARVNGDQEKGGNIKPVSSFDKGGAVVKPWWDFLGWVTGMKSVEQGKTGIYSDSAFGRTANRTATTNKAIQEMLGRNYEEGGGVRQTSMGDNVADIRRMITASQMRQEGRNLLGTDKDFPGQNAVVSDDLMPKPSSFSPTPQTSPSSFVPMATEEAFGDLDGAAIINLYQQASQSPIMPVTEETPIRTSSYVSDAFGSGIAFSVLQINPWGN